MEQSKIPVLVCESSQNTSPLPAMNPQAHEIHQNGKAVKILLSMPLTEGLAPSLPSIQLEASDQCKVKAVSSWRGFTASALLAFPRREHCWDLNPGFPQELTKLRASERVHPEHHSPHSSFEISNQYSHNITCCCERATAF